MRNDFAKVIVERPRTGSHLPNLKTRLPRIHSWDTEADEYTGPLRISRRARWHSRDAKGQTDFLSPLTRFLHAQVGKPWNRVWSEIKHRFDERSLVQWHFVQHVKQMVELNCFIGKGSAVYDGSPRDGGTFTRVDGFYVHPETKTLEWADSWRNSLSKHPEHPVILIVPDANTEYRRIGGIWYVLTYAYYDPEETVSERFDGLLGKFVPVLRKEQKDAPRRYLLRRKQANRKELLEIRKYLADAPQLIKKRDWQKLTVGHYPNPRTALLAKNVSAKNIQFLEGEFEAVFTREECKRQQLGQVLSSPAES
ncbi:MAG: hypothetical protein Q7S09_01020 [bacterium]|nr:hypothetical protein [bacterium]